MDMKEEKALGNFTMSDKPTEKSNDKNNDAGNSNDAYEEEETVLVNRITLTFSFNG